MDGYLGKRSGRLTLYFLDIIVMKTYVRKYCTYEVIPFIAIVNTALCKRGMSDLSLFVCQSLGKATFLRREPNRAIPILVRPKFTDARMRVT
jgi:hypothetical protein